MNARLKHFSSGVILLLVIALLASVVFVYAQAGFSLAVQPAESDLVLNGDNTTVLDLYLSDAEDINGFDIIVTYDSSIANLSTFAEGGFLQNLFCLIQSNAPGEFRYVCTQINSPGVSGNGSLVRMTFVGLSAGTSPITIEKAELTKKDSSKVYPTKIDGSLKVFNQFLLSGLVALQGQIAGSGITVSLGSGTLFEKGPYSTISLSLINGNVNFGIVVCDTYSIMAGHPGYLALTETSGKTVTVSSENATFNPLRLLAGNAVWTDNVIDDLDLDLIRGNYLRTTADLGEGETLDADVNFDGVVDVRDLALAAGNYGLSSADAYLDWVP